MVKDSKNSSDEAPRPPCDVTAVADARFGRPSVSDTSALPKGCVLLRSLLCSFGRIVLRFSQNNVSSGRAKVPMSQGERKRASPQAARPGDGFQWATLTPNAPKVICIGRNYADHIKELNNQRPKQPFFFLKPPSAILLPSSGPVLRPRGVTMHFEVELGLVIGRSVRDLEEDDEKGAMDAIESYVLAIDMTARNVQDEAKKKGLPWSIAKGFDTFLPISNVIPKSKIPNPHDAQLWLSVNDSVRQQDSTELMLFRIPRQLSDISKVMTLEKGDIVLTGTPKGVGPVHTGDVMRAGLKVDGKALEEANIEIHVKDREGLYEFKET